MEECPACGDRWLAWETARRLDELLTAMLSGDVEVATRHFEPADQPAALRTTPSDVGWDEAS